MKRHLRFLSLLVLLGASRAWAMNGIVVVHEAPIHLAESSETPVIQTIRKGEDLVIHDRHFGTTVFENTKDQQGRRLLYLADEDTSRGFYEVKTASGQSGYILKKYVKPVYKDPREFSDPMPRYNPDHKDYRIAEPLPTGYPLYDLEKRRALLTANLGPSRHILYPYPDRVVKETSSSLKGFNIYYLGKASFDNTNRLYFGANFSLLGSDNEVQMEAGRFSKESSLQMGIGPYLSYDPYRTDKYALTIGGGFNANYHRYFVSQGDGDGSEERMFSGLSLTPKVTTTFQVKSAFKDVDFVLGADALFNLPFSLKSNSEVQIPEWWQGAQDEITYPLGASLTFFIGIQGNY